MTSLRKSRRPLTAMTLGLALTAGGLAHQASFAEVGDSQGTTAKDATLYYYTVVLPEGKDQKTLTRMGFDVASVHAHDDTQIMGTENDANKLRSLGYSVTRDGEVYANEAEMKVDRASGTFYGGYRLPSEHERHNKEVAQKYSKLVKLHTIGKSYSGEHPIQALCISNIKQGECGLNQNSTKPKFTIIAQIHARELSTGEMAWRFIDHLTQGYGSDSEVTNLLDSREIWIVSSVNPDGIDKVAEGGNKPLMQRKNMNYTNGGTSCGMSGNKHGGVDLNRNSSFHWSASQGEPCDATYPGQGPASEPETKALQDGLLSKIYPDLKGSENEKVKPGATGGFVTLHSYSNLVLFPYGWTNDKSPDHEKLKEYSDGMARILGYKSEHGQSSLGYTALGTTDDWVYGELGVPAFTYEIGGSGSANSCGGFFPAYRCQDGEFWPKIRQSLMWGAKQAGDPYGTADEDGGTGQDDQNPSEPEPTEPGEVDPEQPTTPDEPPVKPEPEKPTEPWWWFPGWFK